MKTEYTTTPVICTTKDCGYKVTIETDYIGRNIVSLTEEIALLCPKCGGYNFRRMLK